MSVEYYQLIRDEPHGFLQRWFEQANKAEAAAATECAAAIRIQRRWRGYRDRKYIACLKSAMRHSYHINLIIRTLINITCSFSVLVRWPQRYNEHIADTSDGNGQFNIQ